MWTTVLMVTVAWIMLAVVILGHLHVLYVLLFSRRITWFDRIGERISIAASFVVANVAIVALGALGVVMATSVTIFFNHVALTDFLFGTVWNISNARMTGEFTNTVGALGLFWGTAYVAAIALCVAWIIGYPSAVYAHNLAEKKRSAVESASQVNIGIPSIVWGLLALLAMSPFIGNIFTSADAKSALVAGLAMGCMLSPQVTLLVLEGLKQVPRDQWDAGYALGLDERMVFAKIVRPQCRAYFLAAFIFTSGKAITETMIVLLVAGLRSNISLNPLEETTTVTVQIAQLLKGDIEYDNPVVHSSYALMFVLVALVLVTNVLFMQSKRISHQKLFTALPVKRNPVGRPLFTWLPASFLLRLWRCWNRWWFGVFILIPCLLIGAMSIKAWPALWLTHVSLSCEYESDVAQNLVLTNLQINKDATTRTDRKAINRLLLADSDETVACNVPLPVGGKVDLWHKGNTWWMLTPKIEASVWEQKLADVAPLRLQFRPSVLFAGNSTKAGKAGMGQALWTTIFSILIIGLVALPSLLVAVYLHFYLREAGVWGKRFALATEVATNSLIGMPILAFGMIGHALFIDAFGLPRGSGWVIALTLSIVAFPYMVLTVLAAIKSIPHKKGQLEGSQSLGFTYFVSVWKVVVLQAAPAIRSGIIFATVYAIGEAGVLFGIGGFVFTTGDVRFDPMAVSTTLSGQIYLWAAQAERGFEHLAALAACVLLTICLLMSFAGVRVAKKQIVPFKKPKKKRPWLLGMRAQWDTTGRK